MCLSLKLNKTLSEARRWIGCVVPEGLQLSIEIKVFLMGRYVCVVQQHGQAMIIEVHLSYLNTEVHQM